MSKAQGHGDAPESRVGTVIAQRYKILSALGQGGIGAVYRAEDTVLRMPVAIKLLKEEYAQEREVVARFDREAKTMTALSHEHIVQAMNFGRTPEGDIVMVMELVEGETLRSVLGRASPLSPPVALEIARQLASALARAHSMGVVHRDLKPENVMVAQRDGRPWIKVLDFGMARVLGGTFGSESPLTKKGAVFGTPEYMPPEQAMGQPVDARADQYAFGVMVFEMLAGRRPFRAQTPLDMLQMQIHQAPPLLVDAMPGTPPGVSAAVAKMMAKRPDERFADISTAAAALVHGAHRGTPAHGGPAVVPQGGPAVAPAGTPTPSDGGRRWWQIFGGTGGTGGSGSGRKE